MKSVDITYRCFSPWGAEVYVTWLPKFVSFGCRSLCHFAALMKAWELGYRTYAQLIEQVRLWTGKGCSKRAVSRFIKERRELQ